MAQEKGSMKRTNFDRYLKVHIKDPEFVARFERAGEAWEIALQIAALRHKAGLSQKELARQLNTSQQHISRLESPSYEGHSLANLRRVASALNARVRVVFESEMGNTSAQLSRAGTGRNANGAATLQRRRSR